MTAIARLRRRIDEKDRAHGIAFPLWIGVSSKLLQVGIAVLAVSQREGQPSWIWLGIVLIAAPHLAQAVVRPWVPWALTSTLVISGAAIIMAVPTDSRVDLAPGILAVIAAEVMATDGLRRGSVTTVVALGVAFGLDVQQSQPTVGEVVIGALVGAMLSWQSRALVAERASTLREHETAALAERQRIAREIHDLVAHSMSVTLLQVSGARRALLDADVDEASAALAEAEAVGRTAMNDIRRTVGVLADGPSPTHALPDVTDVPALVDSVVAAGLPIERTIDGDLTQVGGSAGLHIYRVAQEALTNVAKHGTGAGAELRLSVDQRGSHLVVSNAFDPVGRQPDGTGHGVTGMRERARQLGASLHVGADGRSWVVDLRVAHSPSSGAVRSCLVRRGLP